MAEIINVNDDKLVDQSSRCHCQRGRARQQQRRQYERKNLNDEL